MGRVTGVIIGNDGQVRGAVVKVITNGKSITLCRPISCLYPLEVMPKSDSNVTNLSGTDGIEMADEVDDTVLDLLEKQHESPDNKSTSR